MPSTPQSSPPDTPVPDPRDYVQDGAVLIGCSRQGSDLVPECIELRLANRHGLVTGATADTATSPKETVLPIKPLGIQMSIKMVGPYGQPADLQMICLFKHKPTGDTYQGAAKETDEKLGGILSSLRNRGQFVGESGETFLFTPPKGSIPAKRFMVMGLGDEKDISLDTLRKIAENTRHRVTPRAARSDYSGRRRERVG